MSISVVEDNPEVNVRTTQPDRSTTPGPSGINLILMVKDHGPIALQEIDADIAKCKEKLATLQARRDKIEQLLDIASE